MMAEVSLGLSAPAASRTRRRTVSVWSSADEVRRGHNVARARVLETSHPPVYYVPIDDVTPGTLIPAGESTDVLRVEGRSRRTTTSSRGRSAGRPRSLDVSRAPSGLRADSRCGRVLPRPDGRVLRRRRARARAARRVLTAAGSPQMIVGPFKGEPGTSDLVGGRQAASSGTSAQSIALASHLDFSHGHDRGRAEAPHRGRVGRDGRMDGGALPVRRSTGRARAKGRCRERRARRSTRPRRRCRSRYPRTSAPPSSTEWPRSCPSVQTTPPGRSRPKPGSR